MEQIDIIRKIQEISVKHESGKPNIKISELAAELNITEQSLIPVIRHFKNMAYIQYTSPAEKEIKLTDIGKFGKF